MCWANDFIEKLSQEELEATAVKILAAHIKDTKNALQMASLNLKRPQPVLPQLLADLKTFGDMFPTAMKIAVLDKKLQEYARAWEVKIHCSCVALAFG